MEAQPPSVEALSVQENATLDKPKSEEETEIAVNYLRVKDHFTLKLPAEDQVSCLGGIHIEEIRRDKDYLIWELHKKNMFEFLLWFSLLLIPVMIAFKDNAWWHLLNPYLLGFDALLVLTLYYGTWRERRREIRCERTGNLNDDKSVAVTVTIRYMNKLPDCFQHLFRNRFGRLQDETVTTVSFAREENDDKGIVTFDKRVFVKRTLEKGEAPRMVYTVVAVDVETGYERTILSSTPNPQEAFYIQENLHRFLMKVEGCSSIAQATPPPLPATTSALQNQDFESMKRGRHPPCVVEETLVFPKHTVLESPLEVDRPDGVQILTSNGNEGVSPLLDIALKKRKGTSLCRGLGGFFIFFVVFTLLELRPEGSLRSEDGWLAQVGPFIFPIVIFVLWLMFALHNPQRITVNADRSIVAHDRVFIGDKFVLWTEESSICVVRTIDSVFDSVWVSYDVQVWEANGTTKTTVFSSMDESEAHYIRNVIATRLNSTRRLHVLTKEYRGLAHGFYGETAQCLV